MLLSDRDIRRALDSGRVALDPLSPELIQPSSIDVRLDRWFRLFDNHKYSVIDPAREQADLTHLVQVEGEEPFVLHPGEFVLGATWEKVTLDATIAARLEGKSSLGRLGLLTHSTAGFIDPGFSGHVTLELSNTATMPILLYPGMKVGQLCFFDLTSPAENPYGSGALGSHYQGQRGPTASRSYLRFTRSNLE
ncbi:MAG: dCTP deaminase [Winkia neuii]|uniref:dCTP deaminase, dUMP-forming n=1 Tax=Winkia neuii TaxID=33007 RepID=A0A2I1IMG6_9ACTO|nr:dCTP deaminase [Winkia neuii]OFJ68569.1 deoxycytidine triphosphate deaminase [Actinomyces sp. HMSC064C12]OFK00556.1 deoxycytidine triphosphate deaminase [Actinomyces sp. HMSC072A03]OFT56742.1 deoxycytidine triphosphate deaminase [Actinomyces sp. HMSC06A08]MDK8099777.1 dCTP deaminase [Winkia neuii]MDU3135607.1 dCTP deaminase [Winkia neuii]